jgi:hypothetical protein
MSLWFRLSDPCDALHERFLAALREHVRDWPPSVSPGSSGAFLIDGFLTTYVDVPDPDEGTVVASLRVDFDGSAVYANRVASERIEHGTVAGLGAVGTPESCALEAGRWYLEQLGRPVERHEWFEGGERVHVRWRFAGESSWLAWADRANEPRPGLRAADRVVDLR